MKKTQKGSNSLTLSKTHEKLTKTVFNLKVFTSDEDTIILKLAGFCGFDRVATMFNRTPEAIKARYQFLKAKTRKEEVNHAR